MRNFKNYTEQELEEIVAVSFTVAEVARHFGIRPYGTSHTHLRNVIKSLGISTAHFLGRSHNQGTNSFNKRTKESILIDNSDDKSVTKRTETVLLRRAMLESGVEYICACCHSLPEWNNKPLTLQIDHIDGKCLNNTLLNLRFLCPNCHSQTENYCRKPKAVKEAKPVNPRPRKFEVSKEELQVLMAEMNWTQLGRHFGVTDNAVKKRAKLLGIAV